MLWQVWWLWVAGGIVLAILEVLAPGYIFLGFAIGAVAAGLALLIGWVPGSLAVLVLAFAIVSLIAWISLRRFLPGSRGSVKVWDTDINDN